MTHWLGARTWLAGLGALLAVAGCSPDTDFKMGQTDFVTDEPGNFGRGGGIDDAVGGQATPTAAAPSGRTGTVEEADIYRIDQNHLYYFNTYRGFLVYDLADSTHPKQISRLPVYGYPVEMYVEGNVVYALIRDALYLSQTGAGSRFVRHDTSQLVTIDISDPAQPRVLKTVDIIGELREGVSRKIDNTIYVVSYIPQNYYSWWYDWGWYGQIATDKEQAWVYSFDVSTATNPQLVDKLKIFEGGSFNASSAASSVNRYFNGVAISATANTLHVVENWQTYGYVQNSPYQCGNSFSQQQAVVSVVDISDPTGRIRLHTKFDTYGHLGDQFKQTYVYDPTTQKGYYLGIFDRQEWSSANCSGASFVQNNLEAWDVTDGTNPTRVDSLPFGKPGETVGGSAFDPARKVAFAITSRRVDPFYALSFADPTHLQILSAVDGLSGDMSVFRFLDGNNFMLGIGTDTTDTCTGFATGSTRWRTGVAVSIFDVQKLDAIRLVQRKCVDVDGAEWVTSNALSDRDQAHKMIGMHSDAKANVVTVPVSYYTKTQQPSWWWYRFQTAVGTMTWDLSKYDPTKSELDQNVLATHATVTHPNGSVRRTIVYTAADAAGHRQLLNLSDTHLSLFDLENVDAPVAEADVEIAPDVEELYRFGGFLVEHVRQEGFSWGYDTASSFRVKPVGGTTSVDDTVPVATFEVGQVQRVMKWNDALIIFRRVDGAAGYTQSTQIVVYDLANPAKPVLRSVTDVGLPLYPYYAYWCGDFFGYFGGWWGGTSNWVSVDGGLAFEAYVYDYTTSTSQAKLVYVNLADLDAPSVKEHLLTSGNQSQLGVLSLAADGADHTAFFLSYRNQISPGNNNQLARYKYYVQRWVPAGGDIVAEGATNVPGQLVRSWKSGAETLLLTEDNRYTWKTVTSNGYWSPDPRLHLLARIDASTASYRAVRTFAGRWLASLVGDGDNLYATTSKQYDYYATTGSATPVDTSDTLEVMDASRSLAPIYAGSLGLQNVQAMAVTAGRLYLSVANSGVLTLDVTQPASPVGQAFLRTLGWGTHLEMSGDTLYVAAGNFGVFQRKLSTAVLTP